MPDLKYFCRRNYFKSLLLDTKKYKELYTTSEGKSAGLCAIVFTYLISTLSQNICGLEMINLLKSVFGILISGMMGLLGFLVTGLAMTESIITKKAVRNIDAAGKTKSLAGILFSFYFEGAIVAFDIITMIFLYILLTFSVNIPYVALIILTGIISYFVIFAILYAVALLGSCINFFFVSILYDE